jgi:chromosome segregation ATPase
LAKEEEFRKLRDEAGKKGVMSRTNKPVKQVDLNTKENQLSTKEFELEQTRIDYIRTKNKHKQTEDELNKQDQLSEGLHLIDFEQLKIENQTLNEKKAEKNQDLVKIEDKIKVNAHMLTHVKEKLAFVRRQKAQAQQNQQEMEAGYTRSRAVLANARIKRDQMRDENSNLKKSSGLIGMMDLLYDFENRSNELELMQDRVTELKTRFSDLTAMQHELEAKIAQRQPMDTMVLRMNR